MRNNVKVQPSGVLTIKIKLTNTQLRCKNLQLYHVNEDKTLQLYNSRIEDGYLIFETSSLSDWLVTGEEVASGGNVMVLLMVSMFAVALCGLVLILIGKQRQKLTSKK